MRLVRRSRIPPVGVVEGATGPREAKLQRRFWLLLLLMPAMVGGAVWMAAWLLRGAARPMDWVAMILLAAPVFGAFFLWAFLVSWLRRSARRQDETDVVGLNRRVCLKCRYDLSQLGDEGSCPECGMAFALPLLIKSWAWTYQEEPQDLA
jgi:hypothetical protein